MGCDSIATTISRMGKEPTTLGPEDLKRHRFSAFWLRSSVVSVLIGHVFGFSAENVNISSQFAWIASLLVFWLRFRPWILSVSFIFPLLCFYLFILCFL